MLGTPPKAPQVDPAGYSQTSRHTYFPFVSLQTCFCSQLVVPMGGMTGGWIGWIDGGTSGQIVGGQMGRMSRLLVQIGTISPSTQRQMQLA